MKWAHPSGCAHHAFSVKNPPGIGMSARGTLSQEKSAANSAAVTGASVGRSPTSFASLPVSCSGVYFCRRASMFRSPSRLESLRPSGATSSGACAYSGARPPSVSDQPDLPRRGVEQIARAHDARDAHLQIVHAHGKLVGEHAIRAPDEKIIAPAPQLHFLRAVVPVDEGNVRIGHFQLFSPRSGP